VSYLSRFPLTPALSPVGEREEERG